MKLFLVFIIIFLYTTAIFAVKKNNLPTEKNKHSFSSSDSSSSSGSDTSSDETSSDEKNDIETGRSRQIEHDCCDECEKACPNCFYPCRFLASLSPFLTIIILFFAWNYYLSSLV